MLLLDNFVHSDLHPGNIMVKFSRSSTSDVLKGLWRSFINYISINGGCTGKRIDWDPREEVDRTARFDSMRREEALAAFVELIARTKEEVRDHAEDLGAHEDDIREGNVDQPWREDE